MKDQIQVSRCNHCKAESGNAGASFCSNCGMPLSITAVGRVMSVNDSGSFGWAILGFFIPVLGFVLYIAWRKARPSSARRVANGALFGYTFGLVFSLFSLLTHPYILMMLI